MTTTSVRTPSAAMIARLIKARVDPVAEAATFASFELAYARIEQIERARNSEPATESQVKKARTLGIQLGWIPRDLPGASKVHKSLQITLCGLLECIDRAEDDAQASAYATALIETLRRELTRPVVNETRELMQPAPADAASGEDAPL